MKYRIAALGLIIAALAVIGSAEANSTTSAQPEAVEEVRSNDLRKQQCDNDTETMSACLSFIKGFLQGALLTDTAIIESIEKTEPSYAERAIRTRLGKRANPPTALAGFCLPSGRSIRSLAEETLDHVKTSERNSAALAKNVYDSLKVDYPCE